MAQNKEPLANKSPIAETEERILKFWTENKVFEKTLEKDAPKGDFIFYEGPPTANGRPGIHHLEARAFKDVIPRYKTMRGFRVLRKAGWDTHGLPVELEVEKRLGLKSKGEIEEYGIEKFNEECKKSVWTYVDEWKDFTRRIGYWIDLDRPYVTYEANYIESIWNIVSEISKRNLIYKDYKVVPWCPRCGTALSSHELAQGYQEVKDLSLYVQFKAVDADEYFLAWTTTPWTLPGNVALAVREDVSYVKVEFEGKKIWLAKLRQQFVIPDGKIIEEVNGRDLVGRKYEALFPYLGNNISEKERDKISKAFTIYGANFVTTEDGTGIVHTAVMYGQDDFELGTRIGLPKWHLVGLDGKFLSGMDSLTGKFVKDEEVEISILKDLHSRGLLFKKEKYAHTYPFCWRCGTPLIYYARDSWYIKMSSLRDELLSQNQEINWEPSHIKDGRFGEWLRDVKDWAISRERYWGTPLPVWVSEDGSETEFIGSVGELKKKIGVKNSFTIMRHGLSDHNVGNLLSSLPDNPHHVTEGGKIEIKKVAESLKSKKIDIIFASDFVRTKETAEIVAEALGFSSEKIIFDKRLREVNFGDLNNHPRGDTWKIFSDARERFEKSYPNGESFSDVKRRLGEFIYEINNKFEGKNILIVGHEVPLWLLSAVANSWTIEESIKNRPDDEEFMANAEVRDLVFISLPHNESFELDLHRPHIDSITFQSRSGKLMKRIPEVMDVWFDSGAMPFAQHHYPFENKEWIDTKGYPADFISEAVDQTRGWFYTLHAIGVLLNKGRAFKNVICLGHILDKDGQKMSKSKGNTVSPWEMIDKYGVDVLRYWMYTVNQPGESKNFDERTVDDVVKKVFNLFLNVVRFYEMYADSDIANSRPESPHVLDKWILSYLDSLTDQVTLSLDDYKILEAARAIREFIGDFSQWYVRRSRERLKYDVIDDDKKYATQTLRFVIQELSKLLAPFAPFIAEDVYQTVTKGQIKVSVHAEDWPDPKTDKGQREGELRQMEEVRKIVSLGLEARAKAGIKIRQPLRSLTIKNDLLRGKKQILELISDEVNVKTICFDVNCADLVLLDIDIDDELHKEGEMRELIRAIQDMRKQKGLSPSDRISLTIKLNEWGRLNIEEFRKEIEETCGIEHLTLDSELFKGESWFEIIY